MSWHPFVRRVLQGCLTEWHRRCVMPWRILKNRNRGDRRLEIGPGRERIPGFETLDIVGRSNVDYIGDVCGKLPFEDATFSIVYASHVLEHVPWFMTEAVLREWVRIISPNGCLEIWVPDGLKICRFLMEAEDGKACNVPDEWRERNPRNCPYTWVQGRVFWGGNPRYPSWHRALFTPNYLQRLFKGVGLCRVRELSRQEVRGHDHGWINLGMAGTKQ